MVEVGALARRPGAADAVAALDELKRGGTYERRLALRAAGAGDGAFAARTLSDPSRLVARAARSVAARIADDAQLRTAFAGLPVGRRRALLSALRRHGRVSAMDGILRELNDRSLIPLLQFAPATLVAERLGALARRPGLDWAALARAHPEAIAAHLLAVAKSASWATEWLLRPVRLTIGELSVRAPDATLRLLDGLARLVSIGPLLRPALVQRRPMLVARLCLDHLELLPIPFTPVVHRLDEATLKALLERFNGLGGWRSDPATWLRRLRPDGRAAIYAMAGRGWRDAAGATPLPILILLPADLRRAEAARHFALSALVAEPLRRLAYAVLLPWSEAWDATAEALHDSEPEGRAAALTALIGCVRFDRDRAADLLAMLVARRYEQDTVRVALLDSLARLPPILWQAGHLDALGRITRHALDATDVSRASVAAIERLLTGMLGRHADWASTWLATLARERGGLIIGPAANSHPARELVPLVRQLDPVVTEWLARETDAAVIGLAGQFGRRMHVWDRLADELERLARRMTSTGIACAALSTLARTRPDRLRILIPALLAEDPSWISQAEVRDHLDRHRQDLLTPFLGQIAHAGRFATGVTALVPRYGGGFRRWTPRQQAIYAASLTRLLDDASQAGPTRLWAVRALAGLPDAAPRTLRRLATDDTRPAVRDAALRGLGQRDGDDGLPALIEALGDARARIAAYALRRVLSNVPGDRALGMLVAVPLQPITVGKEIIRLIGDLPESAGYGWLLDRDSEQRAGQLHRDLHLALLRALWSHLDRDATWPILQRAAADVDPVVAAEVARLPATEMSEPNGERFVGLVCAVLGHADWRARHVALSRAVALPAGDPDGILRPALLVGIASAMPQERKLAMQAFLAIEGERNPDRLVQAMEAVRADRQRLATLLEEMQLWCGSAVPRRVPAAQAVLHALSSDPVLVGRGLRLAAATLNEAALIEHLKATLSGLHADALGVVTSALEARRHRTATALEAIEAAFAGADDERLRRIALAGLVGQARTVDGWTDARVARLHRFRADPSVLVAEAAQFTFPEVPPIEALVRRRAYGQAIVLRPP